MNQLSHLVDLADAYMGVTDLKEVTLSHRVFGDSKKLTALRGGADITVGRFNAALHWFDENWPDGAKWPDHVAKPITAERLDAVLASASAEGRAA